MRGRRIAKRQKYGNRHALDEFGVPFHSKRELARWRELKLMQAAGKISGLKRQVRIGLLGVNGERLKYDSGRGATLVVDFCYIENGAVVYEDTKGFEAPLSKLKRAIARAQGIEVVLTR